MDEPENIAYVIILIEKFKDSYSVEPVGVYTDLEVALEYTDKLEDMIKPPKGSKKPYAIFDILEFEIDKKPILLEYMQKDKDRFENGIEKMLIKLMKKGLVDQLIGEDGHFYYVLTDSGKKIVKGLPPHIRKYFDK
tara:strand:- start:50 stop:457 length:408 start_codon:yes stop_codon:yes gene_type:complete